VCVYERAWLRLVCVCVCVLYRVTSRVLLYRVVLPVVRLYGRGVRYRTAVGVKILTALLTVEKRRKGGRY
jgi:hypothetical protein